MVGIGSVLVLPAPRTWCPLMMWSLRGALYIEARPTKHNYKDILLLSSSLHYCYRQTMWRSRQHTMKHTTKQIRPDGPAIDCLFETEEALREIKAVITSPITNPSGKGRSCICMKYYTKTRIVWCFCSDKEIYEQSASKCTRGCCLFNKPFV